MARQLSNDPEREDRPANAAEAKQRFEAHLQKLADNCPPTGLSAPTAAFIDDLIERSKRYIDHLFLCFDDSRIPASTNALEGFFGKSKAQSRRVLGAKSTTNSLVANLGAELLIAAHQLTKPDAIQRVRDPSATTTAFVEARKKIAEDEAPAVQQRSRLRYFEHHLRRLLAGWRAEDSAGA